MKKSLSMIALVFGLTAFNPQPSQAIVGVVTVDPVLLFSGLVLTTGASAVAIGECWGYGCTTLGDASLALTAIGIVMLDNQGSSTPQFVALSSAQAQQLEVTSSDAAITAFSGTQLFMRYFCDLPNFHHFQKT